MKDRLVAISASLLLALLLVKCGDDASGKADATGDGSADVAAETIGDTAVETQADTSAETEADTAVDTAADTAVDAAPDTSVDTVPDTTVDTTADTAEDTTADTAIDTTADAEAEATATPHLELSGPDGPIDDGGSDAAGDQTVGVEFTRTYTISNTGTGPLTITGVTFPKAAPVNCDQSLSDPPDETVPAGDSTTFDITAVVPDPGAANCPFVVGSDDPDAPAFTVDIAAAGIEATPTVKKSATATCGIASNFGILVGVLADFTDDGTLVTTNTTMGNCTVTTQVGTLPGGTTVNHGADSAMCGNLGCSESANLCNAFGGAPFSAGGSVTLSMTDVLLGGTVTHSFPVAPGKLTRSSLGATQSRGAPLTITTSGGVAGTLTLVTIHQDNPDGQSTVICEYPADSPSVIVPTSILGLFHDGAFDLLVDTRVQSFSVENGYDVVLVVVNSTDPQQSSFTQ